MRCATKGCADAATHRVTMRDAAEEDWTADVCAEHVRYYREIEDVRQGRIPGATLETNAPTWRFRVVTPL